MRAPPLRRPLEQKYGSVQPHHNSIRMICQTTAAWSCEVTQGVWVRAVDLADDQQTAAFAKDAMDMWIKVSGGHACIDEAMAVELVRGSGAVACMWWAQPEDDAPAAVLFLCATSEGWTTMQEAGDFARIMQDDVMAAALRALLTQTVVPVPVPEGCDTTVFHIVHSRQPGSLDDETLRAWNSSKVSEGSRTMLYQVAIRPGRPEMERRWKECQGCSELDESQQGELEEDWEMFVEHTLKCLTLWKRVIA